MPKKILIADDEPHMLRVTELSLKKGGYDLVMARNGREAIEIARRDLPNLIVMDILMPEVDGLTALKVIKEDPLTAGIPVIMFSARGQLVTRKDGQASGAALFITKPFSPTQLLNEARRLLGDGS